jgi:protein-S-isoprenylcysteine O-methyltransferase Ste14
MEKVVIALFGILLGSLIFGVLTSIKGEDRAFSNYIKGSVMTFGAFLVILGFVLEACFKDVHGELTQILYTSLLTLALLHCAWGFTDAPLSKEETKSERTNRLVTRWVLAVILVGIVFCATIR